MIYDKGRETGESKGHLEGKRKHRESYLTFLYKWMMGNKKINIDTSRKLRKWLFTWSSVTAYKKRRYIKARCSSYDFTRISAKSDTSEQQLEFYVAFFWYLLHKAIILLQICVPFVHFYECLSCLYVTRHVNKVCSFQIKIKKFIAV